MMFFMLFYAGIVCGILLIPGPGRAKTQDYKSHQTEEDSLIQSEHLHQKSSQTQVDNTFDCILFKKPSYILFCLGLFMMVFGYYIPQIYLPEYSIMIGNSDQKSANLISVIGFTNLASRLLFGCIGDFSPRFRIYLCAISLMLLGVINLALPLFESYSIFLVYASLFGIAIGCFISLFGVVLVDLYGLKILETSLGQAMASNSPVFLIGTPFMGFLMDKYNSMQLAFLIPGAAATLGGIIFLFILCVHDFDK